MALVLLLLALAACGGQASPTAAPEPTSPPAAAEPTEPAAEAPEGEGSEGGAAELGKTTIRFGYMAWADCEAFTNIVAKVLEDEGYTVELIAADTGVVYQSLADGELDATLCSWQPVTHEDYINKYEGQIELVAVNLEGARLGWAVPTYLEDINSIEDLKGKADMFNGEITGIDPGAGLMRLSAQVIEDYELDDYTLVESSDAAMTAALDRAIRNNQPIVVTTWAPHIMWAKYDVKWLEDPLGTLGEAEEIATRARLGLQEDSPRAYQILSRAKIDPTVLAGVMLQVQEGTAVEDAAEEFINSNPDLIAEWTATSD